MRRPSLPRFASDERHAAAWTRENPAQAQALVERQARDQRRADRRQRLRQAGATLLGAIAFGAALAWFGAVNAGNMRKPPPPVKQAPVKERVDPYPAPDLPPVHPMTVPDKKVYRT